MLLTLGLRLKEAGEFLQKGNSQLPSVDCTPFVSHCQSLCRLHASSAPELLAVLSQRSVELHDKSSAAYSFLSRGKLQEQLFDPIKRILTEASTAFLSAQVAIASEQLTALSPSKRSGLCNAIQKIPSFIIHYESFWRALLNPRDADAQLLEMLGLSYERLWKACMETFERLEREGDAVLLNAASHSHQTPHFHPSDDDGKPRLNAAVLILGTVVNICILV